MTSYFVWDGGFYEQTEGVVMGSPLSALITSHSMELFESLAIETALDKSTFWWRYVDDNNKCLRRKTRVCSHTYVPTTKIEVALTAASLDVRLPLSYPSSSHPMHMRIPKVAIIRDWSCR
ncbi:hypothetical protein Trydic_g8052 [Trypoxylus dichotomus]